MARVPRTAHYPTAMLAVFSATGARISELSTLRRSDYHRHPDGLAEVRLEGSLGYRGHGDGDREARFTRNHRKGGKAGGRRFTLPAWAADLVDTGLAAAPESE